MKKNSKHSLKCTRKKINMNKYQCKNEKIQSLSILFIRKLKSNLNKDLSKKIW